MAKQGILSAREEIRNIVSKRSLAVHEIFHVLDQPAGSPRAKAIPNVQNPHYNKHLS
jgi:hypothetical protein